MSFEVTITSKGQITLPINIRRELNLKTGDKLIFDKNRDNDLTIRPGRKGNPFEKYRGIGNEGIGSGLEEINKHIRDIRGFDPDDPSVE
jgi:antitoxin PrlF